MKHLAVVVDWYGPYSPDEAKVSSRIDYDSGLYLGIGKRKHQKSAAVPQYIGLSKNLAARLSNHNKLPDISRESRLWLGEVATAHVPGKKLKKTQATLDLAEWALTYFMAIPMNSKKRKSPPDRAITLLNRWWRKDFETPWIKRPHPLWPDLVDYLGSEYTTRLVWFGGRIKRVLPRVGT
jgi:hypothetical protein